MKILTLQIRKENFEAILAGTQKVEHRDILPKTASRYINQSITDESNEIEVIQYDALCLVNGRQKNARRLTVEVKKATLVNLVDDNGELVTYWENGEEYVACGMEYELGEILSTQNVN